MTVLPVAEGVFVNPRLRRPVTVLISALCINYLTYRICTIFYAFRYFHNLRETEIYSTFGEELVQLMVFLALLLLTTWGV